MELILSLCLIKAVILCFISCDHIVVRTNYGAIIGNQKYVAERSVYEFLGVPYAQPPIGDLRFKNPRRPNPWQHTLNATIHPRPCSQPPPLSSYQSDPTGRIWHSYRKPSEDCLYLNLWTRAGNHSLLEPDAMPPLMLESSALFGPKTGRPVMVWIHGGSLTTGSIDLEIYNGAYLASMMDVVVVTVQYRLGAFGFLYLGTEDAPGNQGLMDQVAALEWIRENIAYFGGNPQQITLFGHSGGVISVSLHLLSPLSNKLFQQAILQSGSPLAWWAVESTRTAREKAFLLADQNGCKVHTSKDTQLAELARCLRSLDADNLLWDSDMLLDEYNMSRVAQLTQFYGKRLDLWKRKPKGGEKFSQIISTAGYYYDILFKPVVTGELLPHWPYEILGSGKLNIRHRIMLGVNKDEGMFHLIQNLRLPFRNRAGSPQIPRVFEQLPEPLDPLDLLALYIMNENFLHPALLQAAAFEYQIPSRSLGLNRWTATDVVKVLNDVGGDYNIKCPVVEFADFYSRNADAQVFLYSFEHRTQATSWPSWTGVMQGYEAEYIFGAPFNPEYWKKYYNFTDEERRLSMEMMRFWTNFASTGSPNHNPGEFHTKNKDLYWDRYKPQVPITQATYNAETQRRISPVIVRDNSKKHMIFTLPQSYMDQNLRRHECMFWREQLPLLREQIVTNQRCQTNGEPKAGRQNAKNEQTFNPYAPNPSTVNRTGRTHTLKALCLFHFLLIIRPWL